MTLTKFPLGQTAMFYPKAFVKKFLAIQFDFNEIFLWTNETRRCLCLPLRNVVNFGTVLHSKWAAVKTRKVLKVSIKTDGYCFSRLEQFVFLKIFKLSCSAETSCNAQKLFWFSKLRETFLHSRDKLACN